MSAPPEPSAILLDLDGVAYIGEHLIPGAADAVHRIRNAGTPLRFVTNTTTRPQRALLQKLHRLQIPAEPHELFTPAVLAQRTILADGGGTVRLIGPPALAEDLGGDAIGPEDPGRAQWVVLGLHPPALHHRALTVAMRDLRSGARLVALHANRTWVQPDGLALGLGAYVRALEYAAETQARIVGKPSRTFFQAALASLDSAARQQVWMIGDDLEGDVGGAQDAGLHAALVLSGKTTAARARQGDIVPDLVAANLRDACQQLLGHRSR